MSWLRRINIAIVSLAIIGAAALWIWGKPMMDIGTNYAAKQMCSCIYLGGRDVDDCQSDMDEGLEQIDIRHVPEREGVETDMFFISTSAAYYHPGTGCTIEK